METLSFPWESVHLVGSLHLPTGTGPFPAVLMAQGSGPADRDSGGYFERLRPMFRDRGIATFAFDKPGCGQSSGDWRHDGLASRASQMIAGLDLLREHPALDAPRVGVWGHSQGGWLVQRLAGDRRELAFAIANSAPSIGVEHQVIYDCEQTLTGAGFAGSELTAALAHTQSILDAAKLGVDFVSLKAQLLRPTEHQPWFETLPTIEDAHDWQHLQLLVGEPFEPLEALQRVDCPFLAVYGGLDRLLPPWRCAEETGRALAQAETNDAAVAVFPTGDHRIQDPSTGDFVDGYLDMIGDWLDRLIR